MLAAIDCLIVATAFVRSLKLVSMGGVAQLTRKVFFGQVHFVLDNNLLFGFYNSNF
jgi:hypothetical protein